LRKKNLLFANYDEDGDSESDHDDVDGNDDYYENNDGDNDGEVDDYAAYYHLL
jgi:hypothetical protein